MSTDIANQTLAEDLSEYARWIDMNWGVNQYDDDDILPMISMRDDIHESLLQLGQDVSSENLQKVKELDNKWQSTIQLNRDPNFRFNFKNFSEPKSKWWWWIDRIDELSDAEKATL